MKDQEIQAEKEQEESIKLTEVRYAIKKLKIDKASEIHNLRPETIKFIVDEATILIHRIMTLVQLFKKDMPPTSLLCVVYKI